MRMIDADKLRPDCLTKDGQFAISQSQIANAPTIEQPQGEWVEINERIGIGEDNIYTSFKCPFCGYIDLLNNNYCGNCGAKMK